MGSFPIVALVFCVLSPDQAQSLVIGSPQVVVAAPGDDVVLRCYLEPPANVEGLTVEWSQPDLKPDPSDPLRRVEYVHLYRNRHEVTDMKLPSYAGRTQLFTDQLRRGNVSLKILNVTLADAGRYRCFIPKLSSPVKEATVQLAVDVNFVNTTTSGPLTPTTHRRETEKEDVTDVKAGGRSRPNTLIPAGASGLLLIVIVGVGAYCYRRQHKEQDVDLHHQPKLQGDNLDQQRSGLLKAGERKL